MICVPFCVLLVPNYQVCKCVCVIYFIACLSTCATTQVWKSEDNLVLSIYLFVGSRD